MSTSWPSLLLAVLNLMMAKATSSVTSKAVRKIIATMTPRIAGRTGDSLFSGEPVVVCVLLGDTMINTLVVLSISGGCGTSSPGEPSVIRSGSVTMGIPSFEVSGSSVMGSVAGGGLIVVRGCGRLLRGGVVGGGIVGGGGTVVMVGGGVGVGDGCGAGGVGDDVIMMGGVRGGHEVVPTGC